MKTDKVKIRLSERKSFKVVLVSMRCKICPHNLNNIKAYLTPYNVDHARNSVNT